MSGWLNRAKAWAAPACAGGALLLALIVLGRVSHAAAIALAVMLMIGLGILLISEQK